MHQQKQRAQCTAVGVAAAACRLLLPPLLPAGPPFVCPSLLPAHHLLHPLQHGACNSVLKTRLPGSRLHWMLAGRVASQPPAPPYSTTRPSVAVTSLAALLCRPRRLARLSAALPELPDLDDLDLEMPELLTELEEAQQAAGAVFNVSHGGWQAGTERSAALTGWACVRTVLYGPRAGQ